MNISDRLLNTAARQSDRVAGETFIFDGRAYVGTFAAISVDQLINALGGVNDKADYALTARLSQFITRPRVGSAIEWGGKAWAVKADADPENRVDVVLTIIRA